MVSVDHIGSTLWMVRGTYIMALLMAVCNADETHAVGGACVDDRRDDIKMI